MATVENRIEALERMLENLPGDLNVRFDHAKAERDEIKAQISRLQADMSSVKAELKSLPRIIADIVKS